MINELFYMSGYGLYVWSAFSFTFLSFTTLYIIIKVQYMTKKNAGDLDWYQRPLMLKLDDGSLIFPQADDEGNDGGALVHYDQGMK